MIKYAGKFVLKQIDLEEDSNNEEEQSSEEEENEAEKLKRKRKQKDSSNNTSTFDNTNKNKDSSLESIDETDQEVANHLSSVKKSRLDIRPILASSSLKTSLLTSCSSTGLNISATTTTTAPLLSSNNSCKINLSSTNASSKSKSSSSPLDNKHLQHQHQSENHDILPQKKFTNKNTETLQTSPEQNSNDSGLKMETSPQKNKNNNFKCSKTLQMNREPVVDVGDNDKDDTNELIFSDVDPDHSDMSENEIEMDF